MKKALLYSILLLGAVMFFYPFFWMLMASITPSRDISSLTMLPPAITFDSYLQMFAKIPIGRAFFNSLLVAGSVTAGVLVFSSMVGYALSLLKFRGRELIFYIIIFTMTLPFQITLIPQYILMVEFGWTDTYLALIIPYFINALGIILFRQHFKTFPVDLIDAARIDGCGDLYILFKVLWPNSIPALVTVGILTFMATWNEVLWPLIVIRNEQLMTMPQLVTLFAIGGRAEAQLGAKLAAATTLAVPVLIAYTFFQRYFIQSMAATGLKE
jgi:ABC-type glycerol-3-phosphate transport system permease component